MNIEKLYSRIEKLLAMIEDNKNENEVKVARKKLYNLMTENNISKNDLPSDNIIQESILTGKKRTDVAEISLLNVCGEFCGCYVVFTQGQGRYMVFGKQSNINDAMYLFNNLKIQVESKTNEWYLNLKKQRKTSSKEKNAFKKVMVINIGDRLSEITNGFIKYNGEMGLTVINDSVSNFNDADVFCNRNMKIGTSKTSYISSSEINSAASNAANGVTLQKPITGNCGTKYLN